MKKMVMVACIGLLVFSAGASAGAKEKRSPAAKRKLGIANCMSLQDTGDIFSCLSATDAAEEERINRSYEKLRELLKEKEPQRFKMVRDAQLAWIKFRNADCMYDSSADDVGEAAGAADQICRIKSTMDRRAMLDFKLDELKRHLKEAGE